MKKIRNPKSGATHFAEDDSNKTLCGVVKLHSNWQELELFDWHVSCKGCQHLVDDDDEIDPLGIIPDDLPDGAYWAMHWELYGGF